MKEQRLVAPVDAHLPQIDVLEKWTNFGYLSWSLQVICQKSSCLWSADIYHILYIEHNIFGIHVYSLYGSVYVCYPTVMVEKIRSLANKGPPSHTNLKSHDKYWESTWETFNLHNLLIGVTNEQPGSLWQTKTHHLSHNQFLVKHLIFPIAISVHQRGPKHDKPIRIEIYSFESSY